MNNTQAQLPLAKAIQAGSLPGVMRKIIEIPAGRQGIIIMRSGKARMLPPGRHIASVALPRIIWNDTGDWCGYLPADVFPAFYNLPNLLSGDDDLLDASLLCLVKVTHALQFFQGIVVPQGMVPASGLELPGGLVRTGLEPLVRRYTAADLAAGLPTDFLLGQMGELMRQQLANLGLELVGVQVFSFLPAVDRIEIAAKLGAMEALLADAQVQSRLESAQDQAGLDGAMRELQEKTTLPAVVRPVLPEPHIKGGLITNLKKWLGIAPAAPRPANSAHLQKLIEESTVPGASSRTGLRLEHLATSNPTQVDQVVRRQVERELEHIQNMLTECRSRLYRAGDEATALEVMLFLRNLEKRRVQFQKPAFGPPLYASGLPLSPAALGNSLAYDEGLLVQLAAHTEYAHILQQKVTTGAPVDEDLKVLLGRLDAFEHAFSRRGRIVLPA